MTLRRKFGLLAIIGLSALAWIQLDGRRNFHTFLITGVPEFECSKNDPLSRCAADLNVGYPIGDGLVFAPIEDFF